jgi:hypothetical protein
MRAVSPNVLINIAMLLEINVAADDRAAIAVAERIL